MKSIMFYDTPFFRYDGAVEVWNLSAHVDLPLDYPWQDISRLVLLFRPFWNITWAINLPRISTTYPRGATFV